MRSLLSSVAFLAAGCCCLLVNTGCKRETSAVHRKLGFDEFAPNYNRYIRNWIAAQKKATEEEAAKLATAIATAEGDQKTLLEGQAASVRTDLEKWDFRTALGDYLKVGTPSEIPADLVWQNGMEEPEIGDPSAKKGGVFRTQIAAFPPTIRQFGPNSNNSFRGDLYDMIDMKLVFAHPMTGKLMPGLAREWASSQDGRTIYFRLDPAATYSDGVPVKAKDYLITAYVNVSDYVSNPYQKQYYRENIAQIAMYDDHTISISLPEAAAFAALTAGEIIPSPPHFYAEYGPDYAERYQWRFRPSTGAYEVIPEDIKKGASITQSRVKNWWAKDHKFYRYRFNPDKIVHTVVRDDSKAFELFRAGELDTLPLTRPQLWYEKSEIPQVYDGYIERATFYRRWPKSPLGLYLNVRKAPLDNRYVRIGINFAMNRQKVIDVMYRGDYQRLNSFNEGMGMFSDPSIRARPYSIDEARANFQKGGFTKEGRDGILERPDGTRLSVAITYPAIPALDRLFAILREDAKACGLEVRLDGLEATVAYKKEMQKQHEICLGSWNIEPPMPDFYQFLHSSNALDEKGNPKPQTNNTFVWGRPDTDRLSVQVRTARTFEELRDACWKLQNIIHDEGIFIPGYTVDYIRIGSWRWIKWPDSDETHFSPPIIFDPHEAFVLWIDEDIKEQTMAARRDGKVFPESNRVIDVYREGATTSPPTP